MSSPVAAAIHAARTFVDSAVAGINHHGAKASDATRTRAAGQKNDGNGHNGRTDDPSHR
jgi:hypothetical protein